MIVFERILAVGLILSWLIRDVFGYATIDQGILICGLLIAIFYLFGYWWLNKPEKYTLRTISMTILYGIAFSTLTFALLFKILFLSGSDQMTLLSFVIIISVTVIDLVMSINRRRVINSASVKRILILIPGLILCFVVEEQVRIKYTYRKYPDFIKHYELNKDKVIFYYLQKDFFNKGKIENIKNS
jgi:hypothetical protein